MITEKKKKKKEENITHTHTHTHLKKKKKAGMSSVYGLLVIIVKDIREEKSTVGCGHCRPKGACPQYMDCACVSPGFV